MKDYFTLPQRGGKMDPDELEQWLAAFHSDDNRSHMVLPGVAPAHRNTKNHKRIMKFTESLALATGALLIIASSCSTGAREEDGWRELLAESDRLASGQQWEPATEYAIKALNASDSDGGKSLALSRLAALDILTWRDTQGWEHALEAERLARGDGADSLIAIALLQKGRLQLCGAITEGEAQDEEAEYKFGFIINAFKFGAPPHGGLAFGFDRVCALFGGQETIRDYIAFPKNNQGRDVMIDSPSKIDQTQMDELFLASTVKE